MNIVPKKKLTEAELQQLRVLADLCNMMDGIRIKLNWVELQTRPGDEVNDYLVYNEEGSLVAYLGMYSFVPSEAEISGLVHPSYRRHGLFTQLIELARDNCKARGIPQMLFICHQKSVSGHAFVEHMQAEYKMSEHWMRCELEREGVASPAGKSVLVREATEADRALLIAINQDGFDMTEASAAAYVNRTLGAPLETTFIVEAEGQAISKLGLTMEEGAAFIYGFCVLKEFRGQGYGRAILRALMCQQYKEHGRTRFELEVGVENNNALGLYESCGFQVVDANDYYRMTV